MSEGHAVKGVAAPTHPFPFPPLPWKAKGPGIGRRGRAGCLLVCDT